MFFILAKRHVTKIIHCLLTQAYIHILLYLLAIFQTVIHFHYCIQIINIIIKRNVTCSFQNSIMRARFIKIVVSRTYKYTSVNDVVRLRLINKAMYVYICTYIRVQHIHCSFLLCVPFPSVLRISRNLLFGTVLYRKYEIHFPHHCLSDNKEGERKSVFLLSM